MRWRLIEQPQLRAGLRRCIRTVFQLFKMQARLLDDGARHAGQARHLDAVGLAGRAFAHGVQRSEEHTSELQSRGHLVCRLLPEKKKVTTERESATRRRSA